MLAKRQVRVLSFSIRSLAQERRKLTGPAAVLAACVLAAAALPGFASANEQPSSLIERSLVFDTRNLLTQAPSFAEFRKTASTEATWEASSAAQPVLALTSDFVGYLERGLPMAVVQGAIVANTQRNIDAVDTAETARADAARADAARADAARSAIRRVERQAALRQEQHAALRDEQQRRAAARNGVRPPLKLTDEQLQIARFVANRYRVDYDHVQHFVAHAYDAAREFRLDPHLVLAVVAIESSFDPKARSKKGAQGLMQVMTRVHTEKFAPFGGPSAAFDPVANLRVGSRILKEYLVREGSVEGALKSYVGAALLKHDFGYGKKVLSERKRIAAAADAAHDGTKLTAGESGTAAAKGKTAVRNAGSGYVKVAATRFGDSSDGETSAQRLLKSPIGY